MRNDRFQKFCAFILLLIVPAVVTAQARPVTLQVTGNVQVNGKPAPPSGVIFPGDSVKVGGGSKASLISDGLQIEAGENSSFIYGENALDLSCGSLSIGTTKGTVVRTVGYVIGPEGPSAKFSVMHGKDGLVITATENKVKIDSGKGEPLTINAGQSITHEMQSSGCGAIHTETPGAVSPYGAATVAGAAAGLIAYCTVGRDWCRKEVTPSKP
jgi:hypothetical protein